MTMTTDRWPTIMPADDVPGPAQGRWTYKEYALVDDGKRYEVMNGVLLMTPAPGIPHQETVFELATDLRSYVRSAKLGRVFIAPIDVELAPGVVVQPDVAVVLNNNLDKITQTRIIGAPDLAVEVASPGTAHYDRREKYDAYARAGVSEYWIADPAARTIEVFSLEGGTYYALGIFQGKDVVHSRVLPGLRVSVEQIFAMV
jgi:Uma2 family endonuclease